jgi:K+ transporter
VQGVPLPALTLNYFGQGGLLLTEPGAVMHLNAQRPGAYFNIPSTQVMEIGVEFEI